MKQQDVKREFGHDLSKSYYALPKEFQILSKDELKALNKASNIYSKKGFEYFDPEHALCGYNIYPDLEALDRAAKKLLGNSAY